MINTCKKTKELNKFVYAPLPSPRDVFRKYGERLSDQAVYTSSPDDRGVPQMVSASSVIDQMINAQMLLEADVSRQKSPHGV